jgi:hypothetical protein
MLRSSEYPRFIEIDTTLYYRVSLERKTILMTRTFIEVPSFTQKWFSMGLTDKDLAKLQAVILDNPDAGDVMEGTGGLRKLRFAVGNRGKSHGVRVCYVDFLTYEKIYLIHVFSKNEKDNLSESERNSIKKIIGLLKLEAAKNWSKKI